MWRLRRIRYDGLMAHGIRRSVSWCMNELCLVDVRNLGLERLYLLRVDVCKIPHYLAYKEVPYNPADWIFGIWNRSL
jgi:hypothetical protein